MVRDKDQNRVSFCEDWEFYKAPFGSERRGGLHRLSEKCRFL